MNARLSISQRFTKATLIGLFLATLSVDATAQSPSLLDANDPVHATLMPAMQVTASVSDATPQRWSIASTRPVPVTLMPTMTVTPGLDSIVATAVRFDQDPDRIQALAARQRDLPGAGDPPDQRCQLAAVYPRGSASSGS